MRDFCSSGFGNIERKNILKGSSGQIVVEYVLLLVIGVGVAIAISTVLVSRDPSTPGFLIKKWSDIITFIGQDLADDTADS